MLKQLPQAVPYEKRSVEHHNYLFSGMSMFPDTFSFAGFKFRENVHCCTRTQIRFPVSKKRRIRKKFRKDIRNYKIKPDPNIYRCSDMAFGHPETINKVLRYLKGNNE